MQSRWGKAAAALLIAAGFEAGASAQSVDVSRLPIDLERVRRELQKSAVREEREGLDLRYFVDVYAQAPPLVIFGPEANLGSGPVPYGAPTHREMVEHVTPKEYRPAVPDFSALLRWLRERGKR